MCHEMCHASCHAMPLGYNNTPYPPRMPVGHLAADPLVPTLHAHDDMHSCIVLGPRLACPQHSCTRGLVLSTQGRPCRCLGPLGPAAWHTGAWWFLCQDLFDPFASPAFCLTSLVPFPYDGLVPATTVADLSMTSSQASLNLSCR